MKKILNITGYILSILSIGFVIYKLVKLNPDFDSVGNKSGLILSIAAGIVIGLITVFILAYAWYRTVSFFSKNAVHLSEALTVYARANLAKYIPGSVFQYIERNLFFSDAGLDQLDILAASIAEIIGLVIAALLSSALTGADNIARFLRQYGSTAMYVIIPIIIFAGIGLLIFLAHKIPKIKAIMSRIFSKAFIPVFLINILLYSLALIMLGGIMLPLFTSVSGLAFSPAAVLDIISAFLISWLAGYIMFGVPGGIGVRELVFTLLFTDSQICSYMLVVAVFTRLVNIITDFAAFAIASLGRAGHKIRQNKKHSM